MDDESLIPAGWQRNCDTTIVEVNRKVKVINDAFDQGTSISTRIIFQTKDFLININYHNMVFAMCYRDVLTLDLDFPAGYWNAAEADMMIKDLKRFTQLMHEQHHKDYLFKIYRTDKGLHAILCNKHLSAQSDEALSIMMSLCNDPFYTAFSKISGFCLRIGPKLYRETAVNKPVAKRALSEIIAIEYDPKFIGYGVANKKILSMLIIKNALINFVKKAYRTDQVNMTKIRYIPYIDDFRHCPPQSFFEQLIDLAETLYSQIEDYQPNDIYRYNINYSYSPDNFLIVYQQDNLKLLFDQYNSSYVLAVKDLYQYQYNDLTINDLLEIKQPYLLFDRLNTIIVGDELNNDDNKQIVGLNLYLKMDRSNELLRSIIDDDYKVVGEIGDYMSNIISLIKMLIDKINDVQWITTKLRSKVELYYGPGMKELDRTREIFIDLLDELNLAKVELYPKEKMVKSARYSDILPEHEYKKCFININRVEIEFNILKPYVLKAIGNNKLLLTDYHLPFVYGQSEFANMVFIALYDILMLDWDIVPGFGKSEAIDVLERFVESQENITENNRVLKTGMCFKIYETDNGIHAYLISHRVPHNSLVSTRIMIEVCSDIQYAAMSIMRGFSIRLTPKVFGKGKYFTREVMASQFVQSPGYYGVEYIGDTSNINPALEAMVDTIYETQQHILSYDPDLIYNTLINRDLDIINEWGQFLFKRYISKHIRLPSDHKASQWASKYGDYETINAIEFGR